jgi:hypothetical protein
MSLTTDMPERSDTEVRPARPAVAARRPATSTRVPRRRWAILSRVGPSVRTVIVPMRNRAAAASRVSAETSVSVRRIRDAAAGRVPSFQLSDVSVPGNG